jgi:hypothetical protein
MPQAKFMTGTLTFQAPIASFGDATSVGDLPIWRTSYDVQITAVTLVPSAAITANGTNFATYTLYRHTAGASATSVATRAWSATNSVALTAEAMTLSGTAANLLLTAADTLTMTKTEDGSGLIIPSMLVVVSYKLTGV